MGESILSSSDGGEEETETELLRLDGERDGGRDECCEDVSMA